jgi:ABC-type uncharacterized transport system involved in gliding motility auxiliary subunit
MRIMMRRQAALAALLTIGCLILGILISRRLYLRLDLTRNKAYTIAPVSQNLYTEMDAQARITYFVSDRLLGIHPMPGEIRDLLQEYASYSHGRIQVSLRDPAKANLIQEVERLGITGRQLDIQEQDGSRVAMAVYTGILIEYLDRTETLPWVFSLDTLEYDLTSRIRALARNTTREAGVIVGDGTKQWSRDYEYLDQALTQAGFKVRQIFPGDAIEDTIGALLVFGGVEDLDDWALYRIDHYIQKGGKVLFALEGVAVDIQRGINARLLTDKGLLAMVASYGAAARPSLVLDRSSLLFPIQSGIFTSMIPYALWIAARNQFANADHPISAGSDGIDLFWASPLELNPPEGVEWTPLFSTTPEAWLQTKNFSINPEAAYGFTLEAEETKGSRTLSAALWGTFPSWFANAPKPVREGSGEALPDLPLKGGTSRIVVVGDSDFASSLIEFTQSWRNLDFIIQTADWLTNDDAIISIRNRQSRGARLDKIVEQKQRQAAIAFARILNVAGVPLGLIILGVLIALRRRRFNRELQESVKERNS